MFDELFTSIVSDVFSVKTAIIVFVTSLFLGLLISLVYNTIVNKADRESNLSIALVVLPTIIAIIILLIGSNVARAFSLAGAFSLIRFRSAPGSVKDMMLIFLSVAVGLATGMGHIGYAFLVTLLVLATLLVIKFTNYSNGSSKMFTLKFLVPEYFDTQESFEEVISKFSKYYVLQRLSTKELGSVFEFQYEVELQDANLQKQLIDDIRVKNGNLSVSIAKIN